MSLNIEMIMKAGAQYVIAITTLITGSIPTIENSIKAKSLLLFVMPIDTTSLITFILQSLAYVTAITFSVCGTINLFKIWKEKKKSKYKSKKVI